MISGVPIPRTATADLLRIIDRAEPPIRRALGRNPSPESRRRLESILEQKKTDWPENIRILRVIEILEKIHSQAGKRLIDMIAKEIPGSETAAAATAALARTDLRDSPRSLR